MMVDVMSILAKVEDNPQLRRLYGINTEETWSTVKLIFGYDDVKHKEAQHNQMLSNILDAGAEEEAIQALKEADAASMDVDGDEMEILSGTWTELCTAYNGDAGKLKQMVELATERGFFEIPDGCTNPELVGHPAPKTASNRHCHCLSNVQSFKLSNFRNSETFKLPSFQTFKTFKLSNFTTFKSNEEGHLPGTENIFYSIYAKCYSYSIVIVMAKCIFVNYMHSF